MELHIDLQKLGLSDKESKIYVAGLELGPATIQTISNTSGIKRSTVYEVISELKGKRLFSETKLKGKRLFTAADPNTLKVMMNDQQRVLDTIFPALRGLSNSISSKPKVYYYDTIPEIREAYSAGIDEPVDEVLDIIAVDLIQKLGVDWADAFVQKRKRMGISNRVIMNNNTADLVAYWEKRDEDDMRVTKQLPPEKNFEVGIAVFGNKIFLTSLEEETTGVLIESEKISHAIRTMFDLIWDEL